MKRRRTFLIVTTVLLLFSISTSGSAQLRNNRGRGRNNDVRYLRSSVERVDKLSGQLKDDIDRALDRSRLDGRNREDRVNDLARDFHEAAAQLKDRFDDGRDLDRAAGEARRVIDLGSRLDRSIGRNRLGGQVASKWSRIRSDLRAIQNAYGYR